MSAVEYAQFLARFEHGDFVSLTAARELKDDRLGFDDSEKEFVGIGAVGLLYTKNGGSGGGASRSMMYPGDVQVFITRHSTRQPRGAEQHGHAARRLGSSAGLRSRAQRPRPVFQRTRALPQHWRGEKGREARMEAPAPTRVLVVAIRTRRLEEVARRAKAEPT